MKVIKLSEPSRTGYGPTVAEIKFPVSPTQRHVLEVLKRRGEATADELAAALEISPSAARQHLTTLRSAGYVAARQERGQPGRPADHFHTTDLTESMFATASDRLSIELLAHIEEEDPELVTRIFERRRRRRVDETQHLLVGKSVGEKVELVASLLEGEGYLADTDSSNPDGYQINLHSCPIWDVATQFGQACTSELEFLRELIPEATVERVTHKTEGAHTCVYQIRV